MRCIFSNIIQCERDAMKTRSNFYVLNVMTITKNSEKRRVTVPNESKRNAVKNKTKQNRIQQRIEKKNQKVNLYVYIQERIIQQEMHICLPQVLAFKLHSNEHVRCNPVS